MKKSPALLIFLIFLLIAGCAGSDKIDVPQGPQLLRYNLSVGERFKSFEFWKVDAQFPGGREESARTARELRWEVLPYTESDSNYLLRLFVYEIDTAFFVNNELAASVKKRMSGKEENRTGELTKMQQKFLEDLGADQYILMDQLGRIIGAGREKPGTEQAKTKWINYANYLGDMEASAFGFIAPQAPVALGSSWNDTQMALGVEELLIPLQIKNEVAFSNGVNFQILHTGEAGQSRNPKRSIQLHTSRVFGKSIFDAQVGFMRSHQLETHFEYTDESGKLIKTTVKAAISNSRVRGTDPSKPF